MVAPSGYPHKGQSGQAGDPLGCIVGGLTGQSKLTVLITTPRVQLTPWQGHRIPDVQQLRIGKHSHKVHYDSSGIP